MELKLCHIDHARNVLGRKLVKVPQLQHAAEPSQLVVAAQASTLVGSLAGRVLIGPCPRLPARTFCSNFGPRSDALYVTSRQRRLNKRGFITAVSLQRKGFGTAVTAIPPRGHGRARESDCLCGSVPQMSIQQSILQRSLFLAFSNARP